jgi:hypothetical protein
LPWSQNADKQLKDEGRIYNIFSEQELNDYLSNKYKTIWNTDFLKKMSSIKPEEKELAEKYKPNPYEDSTENNKGFLASFNFSDDDNFRIKSIKEQISLLSPDVVIYYDNMGEKKEIKRLDTEYLIKNINILFDFFSGNKNTEWVFYNSQKENYLLPAANRNEKSKPAMKLYEIGTKKKINDVYAGKNAKIMDNGVTSKNDEKVQYGYAWNRNAWLLEQTMKNINFRKGFHLPLISFQLKCLTTFTARSIALKGRWTMPSAVLTFLTKALPLLPPS